MIYIYYKTVKYTLEVFEKIRICSYMEKDEKGLN